MKKLFKNTKSSKSFVYDCQTDIKISLKEINEKSNQFKKVVSINKNSVILVSENSIDFFISYFCLIQNNFLVILIGSNIKNDDLNNLILKFRPNFICYPNKIKFTINKKKKNYYAFNKYRLFILESKNLNLHKDLCLLIPTSGSTGESKFVKLTYKNIISNIIKISNFLKINSKHITITTLPPEYTYGLSIINSNIFKGGSIIMSAGSVIEPKFWEIVKKFKVNSFGGVPYTYELLNRIKFEKKLKLIKSIRYLTQAGGKLSDQLQKYMNDLCKIHKFNFYIMYGSTEASPRMSMMLSKKNNKIGSIGRALPGCSFLIKKKKKKVNKPFVKGDLYFKGDNIFAGYANSEEDLKCLKKIEYLKTGDYAYFDKDGYFYIQGRSDRVIKLNGIRIDLDSLENLLKKKLFLNIKLSLNKKFIKAFFLKDLDNYIEIKRKISALSNIHPSNIKIFTLKSFPLTRSNKIDYSKLNKMYD